ncbi:hypothetical protein Tco_0357141 [Tanacetum coccineum]
MVLEFNLLECIRDMVGLFVLGSIHHLIAGTRSCASGLKHVTVVVAVPSSMTALKQYLVWVTMSCASGLKHVTVVVAVPSSMTALKQYLPLAELISTMVASAVNFIRCSTATLFLYLKCGFCNTGMPSYWLLSPPAD